MTPRPKPGSRACRGLVLLMALPASAQMEEADSGGTESGASAPAPEPEPEPPAAVFVRPADYEFRLLEREDRFNDLP